MEEEQALAIVLQRGHELLALSKLFEENDNTPETAWMAECMAATLVLMRQATNRQQGFDAISVLTLAMWQHGYQSAPKLEFVLPEGAGG